MKLSQKFAVAAALLLALDVVGNDAHVTSWAVRHTISGVSNVAHAAAGGIRDAANGWTTDSPRHVVHHRPHG